jgi:PAS domain S-box-containing protein
MPALILRSIRESVIVTDLHGTITFWNEGASALFGYTAREMLGHTPALLYPDPDPAALTHDLAAILAGCDYKGEWRGRHKDGTSLWVEVTTTRLDGADGTPIGFVGVARDITAREAFLSGLAHDLKTPLTSIVGHAELAARRLARLRLPETAPATAHLAQVRAAVRSLSRMIDELADATRLRIGAALELERRPTDAVALVRAVVAQQEGLTGHRVTMEATVPAVELLLDVPRMERVLGNLLANAIKYSPAGGGITVRIGQADDARGRGVVIAVQDRGVGISAEELSRIFEPFHRARNVVGLVPGTGLGLASAQAIVAQHGGTIGAESVEGVGTTMQVWLPCPPPAGRVLEEVEHGA